MFEVKPIAAALGAELHGVDLCTELQPEVYAEIRRLLIKHQKALNAQMYQTNI